MTAPREAHARAAAAERDVVGRYVRRLHHLPTTALGLARPRARTGPRKTGPFNYWWQAHLLDALVDAEHRAPHPQRRRLVQRIVRSIPLRNVLSGNAGWCNDFHDDMAWLALALDRTPGALARRGHRVLLDHLRCHRGDDGLLTWRCSDRFHNVPANGPAAMLFARAGDPDAAARVVTWIDAALRDPASGLVLDGVQGDGHVEAAVWTYNQGVTLGALVELTLRRPGGPWRDEARSLVDAVAGHLAVDGVLPGAGGGDGGLFAGITARYLAVAATALDDTLAADLVRSTAAATWASRDDDGRFGVAWPAPGGPDADDLSVQLGAWLVLEAAATLDRI